MVIDTHVLHKAAIADRLDDDEVLARRYLARRQQNGDDAYTEERCLAARELLDRIIEHCPIVLLTAEQEDELWPNIVHLRYNRGAFPPSLKKLKDRGKYKLVRMDVRPALTEAQRALFFGGMHDDIHLYGTASRYDKVVITEDDDLNRHRKSFFDELEVVTMRPSDVVFERRA